MNGVSSAPADLNEASVDLLFNTPTREFRVVHEVSTDPLRNLSIEEATFQSLEEGRLGNTLRFWVNDMCLVRGRAKTPKYGWYREEEATRLAVPVYERSTGGGVVYHDHGNLNWSFFIRVPGKLLSPERVFRDGSAFVVEALRRNGIDAYFAPPNRIEVSGYKISGMAARSTIHTLLVHGTLLLDSNLEMLNRLCIPPQGCPPVRNIINWRNLEVAEIIDPIKSVLEDKGYKVL